MTTVTSASLASVSGFPLVTLNRTDDKEFAAKPLASGEPIINTGVDFAGGLQDGCVRGGPWMRFGEVHSLNAGTSEARNGPAPTGLGYPTTSRRREDWTRKFEPSWRYQAATPFASTLGPAAATGSLASCPGADSVTSLANVPPAPAVRVVACARMFVPSNRLHTTIALPVSSRSSCGSNASKPGSETVIGAPKLPAAGLKAAWMRR